MRRLSAGAPAELHAVALQHAQAGVAQLRPIALQAVQHGHRILRHAFAIADHVRTARPLLLRRALETWKRQWRERQGKRLGTSLARRQGEEGGNRETQAKGL